MGPNEWARMNGDPGGNLIFSQVLRLSTKSSLQELATDAMDAADATDAAEMVARPAARTPHPTRAGGKDDGSLHKLPQIIYLGSDVLLIRVFNIFFNMVF